VGRDPGDRSAVISHVLGKFDPRVRGIMDEVVANAREAVECLVTNGLEIAMNRFNGLAAGAGKEKQ
jgi:peptidyl-tRNA hydrolase